VYRVEDFCQSIRFSQRKTKRGKGMFSYTAYGLNILSELPLPELTPGELGAGVDVFIRLGKVNRFPLETEPQAGCFYATSDEAYFFWEEDGAYLVRGGREIIVEPFPGVEDGMLRLVILGMALGVLLHQRGLLTLHASAVAVNGGAVAFMGEKGGGKSTTAAALHTHGHTIVADDVVAINIDDAGSPMVFPGFPQLKLWPEAAEFLGDEPKTLPRLHPLLEKRARCVTALGFQQMPLPLQRIYILAEGTTHEVEPLQPQERFIELMRHSYALRFLRNTGATVSHFRQCMRLASSVPIVRLKRPRSLSALQDVVKLVLKDTERL
jgi:hypothetical protein